jgi:hypothetical protein
MPVQEFEEHIKDKAPAFRCYACGDCLERLDFTTRVSHDLNLPASAEALSEIESLLGEAGEPFKQFYGYHNGMVLYRDTLSVAAGVQFYPVEEWPARSQDMREELVEMGWEEDSMPAWLKQGITFGEIPHSANFFVVGVGEDAGKIFYADHDDFRESPIAENLAELLDKIRTDPAAFLYERGCYTRYYGHSDTQWIPKEYVSDVWA